MKNMNQMMKQFKKMQQQMMKEQEKLEQQEVEGTAGGGVVKAIVTGTKQVKSIEIDPEAVDPEDVEMLQDLIVAAVNEAMKKVDDLQAQNLGKLTGGLPKGLF
ncbi:hypothetical protein SAMN05444392_104231 [Seinonella peptonophila]|uniref:Nucleoid-associated protein SAMN05444392_104231 n=1 Tax=Seinonella peptonophila TaxID=112248 RepID=A0A1M4XAV4_9BACL|nr:YbaB/EbfC family nucleoid-associated protein [Seinonella peptonophila]SHE90563.1 hypothetical protein SAMN05444392_104231 [Seinonella peptonophila]